MKKDLFINQLKKLVSFETVTGNIDENNKAILFVKSLINSKAKIKIFKNGKAIILIAGNGDLITPDIGFLVHMDVVSGKPEQFKSKVTGDKIYGRGTSDMKFSIPIGIELLNELVREKSKLSFTLAITTDEETGGEEGAAYLAEQLKFNPDVLIVPDGGDNLTFVNKSKGVCWLSVQSSGKPSHASRPWKGKNALEPIAQLATKLVKIYGKNSLKENWNTTMNIGQIEGGKSVNQVCPEAIMKLDFRYPESDTIGNIVSQVKIAAAGCGGNLKIKIDSTTLPTFTDKNLPVVKGFISSLEKSFKKKILIAETYGASDASHFAKIDAPILMIKPIGGEIHSENEWISVSSCLKFLDALKDFVFNYNPSRYN